jgi:hypothetical protein
MGMHEDEPMHPMHPHYVLLLASDIVNWIQFGFCILKIYRDQSKVWEGGPRLSWLHLEAVEEGPVVVVMVVGKRKPITPPSQDHAPPSTGYRRCVRLVLVPVMALRP